MCKYCGFPYAFVVDYAVGNTVCTNCGSVADREYSYVQDFIPNATNDEQYSPEDSEFNNNDIHIFINIYCSVTLCMSRQEVALIRKTYNYVKSHFPHLIFLHNQEQVIYALVLLKIPIYLTVTNVSVQKIANKLKEHTCLV